MDFLGGTWLVPALPAAAWLKIIWTEPFDVEAIFPGLIEDGQDELADLLFEGMIEGDIAPDEVADIAMEIIDVVSGMHWWFAIGLIAALKGAWSRIGGILLLRGVDVASVSLGAWCAAALALCVEMMEPKKAAEFIQTLNTPPAGVEVDAEEELMMDEAEFMAAMNAPF